jgi:hypothetical protein
MMKFAAPAALSGVLGLILLEILKIVGVPIGLWLLGVAMIGLKIGVAIVGVVLLLTLLAVGVYVFRRTVGSDASSTD